MFNAIRKWFWKRACRQNLRWAIWNKMFEIDLFRKEIADAKEMRALSVSKLEADKKALEPIKDSHEKLHREKAKIIMESMANLEKEIKEIDDSIKTYNSDIQLRQQEVGRFSNQLLVLNEF